MNIGFIGLGHMGSEMARNLIKAGHSLTVYNRTRSKAEPFAELGATIADTPRDVASKAEVVITMLSDDRAVEEVVFPPGNLIDGLQRGGTHVSMSTISVALSTRLAAAHQEHQQQYVAATVFGRPDAAAAGKLFIIAAGSEEAVRRLRPVLDTLGQKTFELGADAPAANVVKLTGNFLITSVIESLAEALAFAKKYGVEPSQLLEVLTGSLFSAPIYQTYGSIITDGKYHTAAFALPLGMKDNTLLLSAADQVAVPMPIAGVVHEQFVTAMATGLENADWSAIAAVTFRNAGLQQ